MKPPSARIRRRFRLRLGGWMFTGVTVFIAVAAINSQTNLLFWTFGLMVGVLMVSVLVGGLMMRGLRLRRVLPDHGAVDEALVMRYELHSRNWLMPIFGMTITELDGWRNGALAGAPQGWVMHLGARANLQAEATGWAVRRGRVEFDRVKVSTTFPFGILSRSAVFSQPGKVVIYPRLHRLRRDLLAKIRATDPAGTRASQKGGGSEEFYGLRDYRPGDSLRMIDWKHAARFGKLVSRDLTRVTPPKLMVLMDLRGASPERGGDAERVISFAASLICEAHLDGFDVGLAAAGVGFPVFSPHHSRFHRTRLLHALGELDLSRTQANIWSPPVSHDVSWVVVHLGATDTTMGPASAIHVGLDGMEEWRQPAASTPVAETKAGAAAKPGAAKGAVASWV